MLFLSPSKVCGFVLYTLSFKLSTNGNHTTLNQGNVGAKDCAELRSHVSSVALFSNGYVTVLPAIRDLHYESSSLLLVYAFLSFSDVTA